MRLIDADALKESLKLPEESGRMGELLEMVIYGVIDDAPTIEERKTGKWMELDFTEAGEYRCDQCGRRVDFKEIFCPTCGARMDLSEAIRILSDSGNNREMKQMTR